MAGGPGAGASPFAGQSLQQLLGGDAAEGEQFGEPAASGPTTVGSSGTPADRDELQKRLAHLEAQAAEMATKNWMLQRLLDAVQGPAGTHGQTAQPGQSSQVLHIVTPPGLLALPEEVVSLYMQHMQQLHALLNSADTTPAGLFRSYQGLVDVLCKLMQAGASKATRQAVQPCIQALGQAQQQVAEHWAQRQPMLMAAFALQVRSHNSQFQQIDVIQAHHSALGALRLARGQIEAMALQCQEYWQLASGLHSARMEAVAALLKTLGQQRRHPGLDLSCAVLDLEQKVADLRNQENGEQAKLAFFFGPAGLSDDQAAKLQVLMLPMYVDLPLLSHILLHMARRQAQVLPPAWAPDQAPLPAAAWAAADRMSERSLQQHASVPVAGMLRQPSWTRGMPPLPGMPNTSSTPPLRRGPVSAASPSVPAAAAAAAAALLGRQAPPGPEPACTDILRQAEFSNPASPPRPPRFARAARQASLPSKLPDSWSALGLDASHKVGSVPGEEADNLQPPPAKRTASGRLVQVEQPHGSLPALHPCQSSLRSSDTWQGPALQGRRLPGEADLLKQPAYAGEVPARQPGGSPGAELDMELLHALTGSLQSGPNVFLPLGQGGLEPPENQWQPGGSDWPAMAPMTGSGLPQQGL